MPFVEELEPYYKLSERQASIANQVEQRGNDNPFAGSEENGTKFMPNGTIALGAHWKTAGVEADGFNVVYALALIYFINPTWLELSTIN